MTLFFALVFVLGPFLTKFLMKVFTNYLVDGKKARDRGRNRQLLAFAGQGRQTVHLGEEANSRTLLGAMKIMTEELV